MIPSERTKEASRIVATLMSGEAISAINHKEMYEKLNIDTYLLDLVEDILDGFQLRLIGVNHMENGLFITPGITNTLFGWKNEDIRRHLNVGNNTDMYLCYFIMFIVLTTYFKDTSTSIDEVMTCEDIALRVKTTLDTLEISEEFSENEISLGYIKATWDEVPQFTPGQENKSPSEIKSGRCRYAFVNKTLEFMVQEGLLLHAKLEGVYASSNKFKAIVSDFYGTKDVRNTLLDLVSEFKQEEENEYEEEYN